MSGNPFRRSKLPPTAVEPPAGDTPSPAATAVRIDTEAANGIAAPTTPPAKRTKKKRVTIVSPNSPEFAYRPADNERRRLSASDSATRAESPPPPPPPATALDERDSETDSTTGDSELDEARNNTRRNPGALPPSNTAVAEAGMKLPYNPFARTLATVEAQNGGGTTREEGNAERQGAGRPALDVDAFKNILMTGSAAPSPPTGQAGAVGLAPAAAASRQPDSSSNTDTSSLFDPRYDLQQESPRTSFDDYEDASETDDGNENSNLMGQGRSDDFAPPAPPKPKSRGPQTVSFAEFEDSIPQGFQGRASQNQPVNAHLTGILRPSTPRSMSDLNKPLPPPPQEPPTAPTAAEPNRNAPTPQRCAPNIAAEEKESTPKKAPAPPPLPPSRRKPGETGRPRSASNLSNNTLDSVQSSRIPQTAPAQISQHTNDSASKLAPPPPPSRKSHAPTRPSGPTSNPASQDPSPSHSTNDVPKAKPPPPPRRHPSNSGSVHSISKRTTESPRPPQKPGDAFLAAFGNTGASTPPVPPPRRGGSKRSSMDGPPETLARRLSTEHHRRSSGGRTSFDSERSASIGSLQQVPEPGEYEHAVVSPPAENQRDVLADMAAFEAEIEALRKQAEGTR